MSPAAHVGIYALDVNDPDGSSVVVRKTSTSHLFIQIKKSALLALRNVKVNLETGLFLNH